MTEREMLEPYEGLLYDIALKIDRNKVCIDDLLNVGRYAILKCYNTFDETRGTKFSSYLYIKAKSAMLDEWRKMGWFSRTSYKDLTMLPISSVDEESSIDEEEIDNRQYLISQYLGELNEIEQEIIKLKYWNGMTFLEIASVKNLSEGRIKQLHDEAIQKIKELFLNE